MHNHASVDENGQLLAVVHVSCGWLSWWTEITAWCAYVSVMQGNPSTGEIFNGIPNLDHSSEVVANDLKNWLQWLRKDHGFDGFRFDYAKG